VQEDAEIRWGSHSFLLEKKRIKRKLFAAKGGSRGEAAV
jgi:hypothetical protein